MKRAYSEAKKRKIWTLVVGVLAIRGTLYSIPSSKLKDMKSDVFQAVKACHFENKTLNLVCGLTFNNFQYRKIAYTSNFFLQYVHYWDQYFQNTFEIRY
jgi:hypothetical protein